jgi:hypothetical protein
MPDKNQKKGESIDAKIKSGIGTSNYTITFMKGKKKKILGSVVGIKASSYMDRCESGVVKGKETDKLLKHEQGHFDISEIWARKLHKALQGLECEGNTEDEAGDALDKKIDKIIDDHGKKMEKMCADYEKETNHGREEAPQAAWCAKIAALLGQ